MKLHWTTWVFIALGVIEIVVTSWGNAGLIRSQLGDFRWGRVSPFEIVGTFAPQFFYAMNWFGTAAMVEFLYRIWMELKRSNDAKLKPSKSDEDGA